jgi:hypothetical protein
MSSRNWRDWQIWLGLGLLFSSLAGCQWMFGSKGQPSDPLFEIKKPVAAKAELAPPVTLAYSEPALPHDPIALAKRKTPSVPGTLVNRPAGSAGEPTDKP